MSINLRFRLTPEAVEELLTDRIIEQRDWLILPVKKPDYLGDSMWEFRYSGRIIEGKILDEDWLKRFQGREIDVRPGDALFCDVHIVARLAEDGHVISTHYDIHEVIRVIKNTEPEQRLLM